LLAVGCWLLAAGCWLLVAGCWLLVSVVEYTYSGAIQYFRIYDLWAMDGLRLAGDKY